MLTKHLSTCSNEDELNRGDEPGTMLDYLLGAPDELKKKDQKI